jgi:hypothetical protein
MLSGLAFASGLSRIAVAEDEAPELPCCYADALLGPGRHRSDRGKWRLAFGQAPGMQSYLGLEAEPRNMRLMIPLRAVQRPGRADALRAMD